MQFEKWKGTMTDRDRFNNQMHYRPIDRTFNMEFGYWGENFLEWPLFAENEIKNNWEADVFFAFDKMRGVSGNIGMHPAFPYEVNSCVHPGELLSEYGKDLRIMGGFDKLEMIKGKKEIKAYMESLVPLVERGGYIPFCDHRCPPDVTPENYLYYLELKEKMFGMA